MLFYLPPCVLGLALVYAFVLGLVFGSFLNCAAWRIAHGESVLKGRSHCAKCGHGLAARDLVPLFSWLLLHGRCRYCGEKISPRYPLTELAGGVGFVCLLLRYDFSAELALYVLLFCLLLTLSLVDLDEGWIPDRLLVAGAAGFVLYAALSGDFMGKLLGGLIGAAAVFVPMLLLVLAFDKISGKESMGGGDLKLYAVLGLCFGWKLGLLTVLLSCLFGLLFALIATRLKPDTPFPFAPAISAAAFAVMMIGEPLTEWYAGLL